ncbi:MAG: YkgJ family cysteine cluster protein [Ferruginibacter sp.]
MADLPYSFEPTTGYHEYKVTAMLRDYLGMLMEHPENKETIEQILSLIDGYTYQLKTLRIKNQDAATKEVYKAIDGFFNAAPADNKKEIQCRAGCTACCFIEIDVSVDEAATIINYCKENGIEIDREYLTQQAAAGRKSYSGLSQCVFLKENLCSIYPVRPIACRKHWVKTDPALCDFSENIINPVGGYFDVNTEILASALLHVDETGALEKMLLRELDKNTVIQNGGTEENIST